MAKNSLNKLVGFVSSDKKYVVAVKHRHEFEAFHKCGKVCQSLNAGNKLYTYDLAVSHQFLKFLGTISSTHITEMGIFGNLVCIFRIKHHRVVAHKSKQTHYFLCAFERRNSISRCISHIAKRAHPALFVYRLALKSRRDARKTAAELGKRGVAYLHAAVDLFHSKSVALVCIYNKTVICDFHTKLGREYFSRRTELYIKLSYVDRVHIFPPLKTQKQGCNNNKFCKHFLFLTLHFIIFTKQ